MILETERLILRPFTLKDAKRVASLINYNIYKYTLNIPYPYDIQMAIDWISTHKDQFDNDKMYEFAITLKGSDDVLGVIGISNDQEGGGELGYWIGEDYWNKGYVTEASHEVLNFVFTHKNYTKVYSRHLKENIGSGRVMQKLSMRQLEDDHETVEKDGVNHPLIKYEILKEDYKY